MGFVHFIKFLGVGFCRVGFCPRFMSHIKGGKSHIKGGLSHFKDGRVQVVYKAGSRYIKISITIYLYEVCP